MSDRPGYIMVICENAEVLPFSAHWTLSEAVAARDRLSEILKPGGESPKAHVIQVPETEGIITTSELKE